VAAPEARVAVVEPLPLLQLSLKPAESHHGGIRDDGSMLGLLPAGETMGHAAGTGSASASAAAAAAPRALRLLQGQAYDARLVVTNTGRVPVGWASVSVR
jgi:hypothetical protein